MQAAIVPTHPRVPMVFDRALTDVIGSRRMVEETSRRLAEARWIVESLEEPRASSGSHPWADRLDDAIRHLSSVEETLRVLLDREVGSP